MWVRCLISVDDANGVLLPNTNVTVTVTEMQARKRAQPATRGAAKPEG